MTPDKQTYLTTRRLLASLTLALGCAPALISACAKAPTTDLTLSLRGDQKALLEAAGQWVEVDVFDGGCPSSEVLTSGKAAASARYSERRKYPDQLPAIGELDTKTYGFAALLKDKDCGIVGVGCTNANLEHIRNVTVVVGGVMSGDTLAPQAACPGQCSEGACSGPGGSGGSGGASGSSSGGKAGAAAGKGGSGGGSGGAGGGVGGGGGCDLALISKGTLPAPIGLGATIGGPAIVATKSGFVVGYRNSTAGGAMDQLVLMALGADGGANPPQKNDVAACTSPTSPLDSGVGLAMNATGTLGLAAISRPPCLEGGAGGAGGAGGGGAGGATEKGAGLTFVTFNEGAVQQQSLFLQGQDTFPAISLVSNHAIARVPDTVSDEFRIVYTQAKIAKTFNVKGVNSSSAFDDILPGLTGTTFATTTSTNDTLASIADGTGSGGSGGGGTQLALKVNDKTIFRDAAVQVAPWAYGERTLVATRSNAGEIGWVVLRQDASTVASATLPMSGYKSVDATVAADRLVFVVGQSLGFKIITVEGASGTPATAVEQTLALSKAELPDLASFDGTQLAVASGNGRVAVAWASRNQLAPSDPTGGYAIFRCQ